MEYEIKHLEWAGKVVRKNNDTLIQNVNIISGIVGQNYPGPQGVGFGFVNNDTTSIEFPSTGLDADQIEEKIRVDSAAFIAVKYPNT